MVFEVLDLDGSDLYKRIFQPPIPSQPTVAEAEGIIRHGAFAVQEALGHLHALVVLQQACTGFSRCPVAAPAISGERLTRIRARVDLHRASLPHPHQAMSRLVALPARIRRSPTRSDRLVKASDFLRWTARGHARVPGAAGHSAWPGTASRT